MIKEKIQMKVPTECNKMFTLCSWDVLWSMYVPQGFLARMLLIQLCGFSMLPFMRKQNYGFWLQSSPNNENLANVKSLLLIQACVLLFFFPMNITK